MSLSKYKNIKLRRAQMRLVASRNRLTALQEKPTTTAIQYAKLLELIARQEQEVAEIKANSVWGESVS